MDHSLDITSGGQGSDWQEVTDGHDIQTQTTFQYNELQEPKHAPPQDAPPSVIVLFFYSAALISVLEAFMKYQKKSRKFTSNLL
jgi:hypothetical protein